MEAIFPVCGAGGPQLKRNPLGSICTMIPVLLVLALNSDLQAKPCGARPAITVTDSGIATLHIGFTVEQVRARCTVVKDTTLPNWDVVEVERVLFVVVGRDTVHAAIDNTGHVARLDVDSPNLRTVEGFGVGTSIRALAKPGSRGGASEATFGVTLRGHCGLRFVFGGVSGLDQGAQLDARQLRTLGLKPRVTRIEIWPCRG